MKQEDRADLTQHNRILAMLPDNERAAFQHRTQLVDVTMGELISGPAQVIRHIDFPLDSVYSVLAAMVNGMAVEAGTVGNEGFVGVHALLGQRVPAETTICQVAGQSLRISVDDYAELASADSVLCRASQRYLLAYLSLVSQSVACNRLHNLSQRFARWILMTHDRITGDEFLLKQEFVAIMLGVHRPSVSVVANAFQKAGIIEYRRGVFNIPDRQMLEAETCECYALTREHFRRAGQEAF